MIQEAVAYYVLGYREHEKSNKENDLLQILKSILEIARNNLNKTQIEGVNTELLSRINFSWTLSSDDFMAYATTIFYVLTKRENKITEEKIVKEFLAEIHSHHPRRTLKEAELILDKLILNNSNV
jgi:hypothetical protein